jgi:photosystem II stability/assembly factor-like uncharacterized protein
MPHRFVTYALLVLALTTGTASAQVMDPELFGGLAWRLVGPFRAGRVLAVSGVPGEPAHFYFGSVNGGVWETRDAGRTWEPIFDGQPIGSIGALAVAPSDPRVLYAGSGEADMRSDIAQGDGMYKSTDGGRTWNHVGLADSQQIGRVLVDPGDPARVLVAALGHPYGANAERGVFRTVDGGASWQQVLGDDDVGAIDLAFEPGNPRVVYAALWQTRRTPWSIYPPSNGPGSGLYKSSDGGGSWRPLTDGLPAHPGRIGLALSAAEPRRVYALIDASPGGGLYRSDDGGEHFSLASDDARIWGRGWYFGGVTAEPRDADVVYACNTILLRSGDGGKTFLAVEGDATGDDFHELWIDPEHPERRILGTDQGAKVSVNGGATWSSWRNQPTGQFYHVTTDDRFPYWVYGSQQDSGAVALPSRTSVGNGITTMHFHELTAGGESDNIAPDPKDPNVIFGGRVDKLDLATGQTRSIDPTLPYPDRYRRTWTLPLVFSRRDPRVLYFANQRVFSTDDGGEHWAPISPDLTREDPGAPPNLDPVTAALHDQAGTRRGVVYAIAPSRTADRDLWAGTDDGLVWRSRDEGEHWQDVTPEALTPWSKVGAIETSHFDAETAYLAVDRHRLDDFHPYVYRTRDGGGHWQLASAGIPEDEAVNVVREDPVRPGLLYAGTEKGIHVSFDDGDHWQPLQLRLPVTSVRDVDVHGDDVVIATHGRGFWILDDVTPLRQLDDGVAAASSWLFRPATAVRFRRSSFTGTPLPKDEPAAPNPPFGAHVDYFLKRPAEQGVSLEIFDASGALVRRFSSDDAVEPADPGTARAAPVWLPSPVTLSAEAGMHRFVWSLRHPLPEALAKSPYDDGAWVPPGRYRLVLAVDGRRHEQPLEVAADPRVDLPPEAYREQHALARRVLELRASLSAAADTAKKLLLAIRERRPLAPQALRSAFDALAVDAGAVAGIDPEDPEAPWWLPPKSIATLRWLDRACAGLYEAIDGADAAPSPDARASLATLEPMAASALEAWQAVERDELAPLDATLLAAGLERLTSAD